MVMMLPVPRSSIHLIFSENLSLEIDENSSSNLEREINKEANIETRTSITKIH